MIIIIIINILNFKIIIIITLVLVHGPVTLPQIHFLQRTRINVGGP